MKRRGFLALLPMLGAALTTLRLSREPTNHVEFNGLQILNQPSDATDIMIVTSEGVYPYRTTIRTGLPPVTWRAINDEEYRKLMLKPDLILQDLKWIERP